MLSKKSQWQFFVCGARGADASHCGRTKDVDFSALEKDADFSAKKKATHFFALKEDVILPTLMEDVDISPYSQHKVLAGNTFSGPRFQEMECFSPACLLESRELFMWQRSVLDK